MTTTDTTFTARRPPVAARRTVDAPTRVFHWLLALSFLGAWITADGERWRQVHVTLGYTMAGLLGWRLVWGLVGPRHARLSALARKLQGLPGWIQGLKAGAPNWRQAQNLLLALSVVAVLALIAPLTLSGYATWNEWAGDWLESVHEFFGNALLAVVLLHLALIAGISVLRRSNQAMPMITGRTSGAGPDLIRNNHQALAILLLSAVLTFWIWQWQQSPAGGGASVSAQAAGDGGERITGERHHGKQRKSNHHDRDD